MTAREKIAHRIVALTSWLKDHAPFVADEQNHLNEGSVEKAYWHYGYLMGLRDAKEMLDPNGKMH